MGWGRFRCNGHLWKMQSAILSITNMQRYSYRIFTTALLIVTREMTYMFVEKRLVYS